MPPKKFICPKLVREHLHYDPVTGQISNLIATPRLPVGHVFSTKYPNTYIKVSCAGQRFAAHRVAWVWMTGEQPDEVDHDNRVRHDNRWTNLKNVTHAENMKNVKRIYRMRKSDQRIRDALRPS